MAAHGLKTAGFTLKSVTPATQKKLGFSPAATQRLEIQKKKLLVQYLSRNILLDECWKRTMNFLVCLPHDNNKVTEFRCHKKSIHFVCFFSKKTPLCWGGCFPWTCKNLPFPPGKSVFHCSYLQKNKKTDIPEMMTKISILTFAPDDGHPIFFDWPVREKTKTHRLTRVRHLRAIWRQRC